MELKYLVTKEKGGRYYAHEAATPHKPIPGSFGDKKHALRFAAKCEGILTTAVAYYFTRDAYYLNRKYGRKKK